MSTVSSTGVASIGGLVSGLQTDQIISQMQQVEQAPIIKMQQTQSTLNTKMQAWAALNTRVLAVKQNADTLANLGKNLSYSVNSSSDTVSASASSGAATGTYTFTVNSLASYHQMSSQTFNDTDVTSIGSGTFSITSNGKTTDLAVDNLTLTGLRDAINNSNANVQAMIVSSGGATPTYHLLLTSDTLGTAGAISLNSTLTSGVTPTFSDLHAASDAKLTFGSGDTAFQVTRSDNKITDVITGVTINLDPDSEGKTVSLTIAQNNNAVNQAVQGFVSQYNAMLSFITQQSSYDNTSKATGPLFGETQISSLKNQLASQLTGSVSGLSNTMNTVSQLGLSFDDTGQLTIDADKLNAAIKDNVQNVLRLFSASGLSENTSVGYVGSEDGTQPSDTTGYAVSITQPAIQAKLTIGTAGAGLPAQLGQDETLTINDQKIDLTTGMTALQVIAAINGQTTKTGVRASLTGADGTGTGNFLSFTNTAYGSASPLSIISSVAADATSTGIGTTALTPDQPGGANLGVVGRDVAGTINGEVATGAGQVLTSANGKSKGLQLLITGTTTGDYGHIVFTSGVGARISSMLSYITDPATGDFKHAQDSLQKQVDALSTNITDTQDSVTRNMDRLRAQFNSMEVSLSKLQSQGAQLNGLIAQMNANNGG